MSERHDRSVNLRVWASSTDSTNPIQWDRDEKRKGQNEKSTDSHPPYSHTVCNV